MTQVFFVGENYFQVGDCAIGAALEVQGKARNFVLRSIKARHVGLMCEQGKESVIQQGIYDVLVTTKRVAVKVTLANAFSVML